MARAASMPGAMTAHFAFLDPLLVPLYWLFLSALVYNCLYPSVLLRSQSAHTQRDAAAVCDAGLDATYFLCLFSQTRALTSCSRSVNSFH